VPRLRCCRVYAYWARDAAAGPWGALLGRWRCSLCARDLAEAPPPAFVVQEWAAELDRPWTAAELELFKLFRDVLPRGHTLIVR
jgi:hypothetical protein